MPPSPNGAKMCNPVSGFLLGCVNGQIFKNCPADKFTANDDCNKIKEFVNKCGCLFPKKH